MQFLSNCRASKASPEFLMPPYTKKMDVGKDTEQKIRHQTPLDTSSWMCIGGVYEMNINPSLVLIQSTKTRPYITERLVMGRKESNQTNKLDEYHNFKYCSFVTRFRKCVNSNNIHIQIH